MMTETKDKGQPCLRPASTETLIRQLKALGAKEYQMFTPDSNPTAGSGFELIPIGSSFFVGKQPDRQLFYIFVRTNPNVPDKIIAQFLRDAFPSDWTRQTPDAALIKMSYETHPDTDKKYPDSTVVKRVVPLGSLEKIITSSLNKLELIKAIDRQLT